MLRYLLSPFLVIGLLNPSPAWSDSAKRPQGRILTVVAGSCPSWSGPFTAAPRQEPERPRCQQGRQALAFGWWLIALGVETLKYVVGLLLIMLGSLFLAVGGVLSLLEMLFC
ncbi:hypothetical protein D9598_00025 [Roseomonas sp. KE0001]|nr:hypothetical protein [Roseomonas sp. KE0001]